MHTLIERVPADCIDGMTVCGKRYTAGQFIPKEEAVAELIERTNEGIIRQFVGEWADHPGLSRYYKARLDHKQLFCPADIAAIQFINQRFMRTVHIHEAACGMAQVGHVLSLCGYHVSCTESYEKRREIACYAGAAVGSNAQIMPFAWQDWYVINRTKRFLFVTVNAVSSMNDAARDDVILADMVASGNTVLICPKLFGDESEKRLEHLERIASRIERLDHGLVAYWPS